MFHGNYDKIQKIVPWVKTRQESTITAGGLWSGAGGGETYRFLSRKTHYKPKGKVLKSTLTVFWTKTLVVNSVSIIKIQI